MNSLEKATNKFIEIAGKITDSTTKDELTVIKQELYDFRATLPQTIEFDELRDAVTNTRIKLNRSISADALQRIQDRTDSVIRFTTAINTITAKAEQDAAQARLDNLQRILTVTKKIATTALEVQKSIQEDRKDEAYAAIDTILQELDKLDDNSNP